MGSRGPGETKIELDRRRINTRIAKLRREIKDMKTGRDTKRRHAAGRTACRRVAIAGYTNAGKSSLLNRLTGAGVLVENQLFATLDPTVRRTETADGRVYTLADTVGFVRSLPHQLVEAFRSTLEEVGDSDLLLHVVDGSHPDPEGQISAVREVLAEVGGDQTQGDHRRQQGRPRRPGGDRPAPSAREALRSSSRPAPAPGSTSCGPSSPTSCRSPTSRSRCSCPTTAATWSAASTRRARCSPASTSPTAPG